jgi:hypothetical protein
MDKKVLIGIIAGAVVVAVILFFVFSGGDADVSSEGQEAGTSGGDQSASQTAHEDQNSPDIGTQNADDQKVEKQCEEGKCIIYKSECQDLCKPNTGESILEDIDSCKYGIYYLCGSGENFCKGDLDAFCREKCLGVGKQAVSKNTYGGEYLKCVCEGCESGNDNEKQKAIQLEIEVSCKLLGVSDMSEILAVQSEMPAMAAKHGLTEQRFEELSQLYKNDDDYKNAVLDGLNEQCPEKKDLHPFAF